MKFAPLILILTVTTAVSSFAEDKSAPMIGNMTKEAFEAANEEAGKKIAAIKPTDTPLSAEDKALLIKLAEGGAMNLEASKVAENRAEREDVKVYAKAEVEEQTGLAEKIKEIADAKEVELPDLMPKAQALANRLEKLDGAEFDMMYIEECGVKGHEAIKATAEEITAKAKDATLKELVMTATPIVLTHLQVAQAEEKKP